MGIDRSKRNETSGRRIFWWLRGRGLLKGFEACSDLIANDYMRRWRFLTPWGGVRVHHILRGDNDRHFHDHPMSFVSIILRGGYIEHTPGSLPRVCRPGSVIVRRGEDLHYLHLRDRSAWTLVLQGPFYREWGFSTEDGWIKASEYDAYLERKRSTNGVQVIR